VIPLSAGALYHSEQIRQCEQFGFMHMQLTEEALIERAGFEAFCLMQRLYPNVDSIAVFCGGGNNAADGYVLARLAHENGYLVTVYFCKEIQALPDVAKEVALNALDSGVLAVPFDEAADFDADIVVDALLGIGLLGPVHGVIATAITQINASLLPVFSLDVPSGLNADTGCVMGVCVNATTTATFIASKPGLVTQDGPDYVGELHCLSLGLEAALTPLKPMGLVMAPEHLAYPFSPRKKNTHKGIYGHVLIIGGGLGMCGAAALAAKAAIRAGAGAVTVALWPDYASGALLSFVPEAMVYPVASEEDLIPLFARATVCVVGPGLGDGPWAQSLFDAAMTSQLPMIIDASALKLLAHTPQQDDNWILTPHPKEAAELLGCTTTDVSEDRYKASHMLQKKYGGVVVLKGTGTLVRLTDGTLFVCPKGNPGMATAGMGDVLSGLLAGLVAQGLSLSEAAKLGVWGHALSSDMVASFNGERGLIASDLLWTGFKYEEPTSP
jgi:hydroxyethylthiazole kinase-like uncharacterized protein yjeF